MSRCRGCPTGSRAGAPAKPRDESSTVAQLQGATAPATLLPLKPYVHATAAGYVMDAPAAVLAKVDPAALASLKAYHSQVAKSAADGSVVLANGEFKQASTSLAARPSVHAYYIAHWYALEVGLDSFLRNKISAGLLSASAIGAYFGGPIGVTIGLVLSVYTGLVNFCMHADGWSILFYPGGNVTAFPVCNPFG